MKDQVDGAPRCITIAALQSDTPEHARQAIFAQLEGRCELKLKCDALRSYIAALPAHAYARAAPVAALRCLLVSPEMLDVNTRLRKALQGLALRGLLSLLAVDEAHCVCDWGTHFYNCNCSAAASAALFVTHASSSGQVSRFVVHTCDFPRLLTA